MAEPVIDSATFAELQNDAGAEFVAELAAVFFEEVPRMLLEMRRALHDGDGEDLRRHAHSLKSNAHTFGAVHLCHHARELELGGLPADGTPIDVLQLEFESARQALQGLIDG